MRNEYHLLHKDMLQHLSICMEDEGSELKKIAGCFWIVNRYWEKLKESKRGKEFGCEEEEIHFFKEVKPEFTYLIEYYCILSEALLFVPEESERVIEYWATEGMRYKRFQQKHREFIDYLERGQTCKDRDYFLRDNYTPAQAWDIPIYDAEMEFCTTYDGLIRRYKAKKKFDEYVINRMNQLRLK